MDVTSVATVCHVVTPSRHTPPIAHLLTQSNGVGWLREVTDDKHPIVTGQLQEAQRFASAAEAQAVLEGLRGQSNSSVRWVVVEADVGPAVEWGGA